MKEGRKRKENKEKTVTKAFGETVPVKYLETEGMKERGKQ